MSTQIELLKKHGLQVEGRRGQHLLIDPNLQKKIVDLLDLGPKDTVFEIGPGLGALTAPMLERGISVWAVEKDERFRQVLKEEFGALLGETFHLIEGDILETDLRKLFPKKRGPALKVIGNLPYYITAPILFHLVEFRGLIERAVLTVQKEVAERIVALPGSKDYGRLSLTLRYFAEPKIALTIPPTCFTPQPEVASAVVVLTFHTKSPFADKKNEKLLFDLIQAGFHQRRKTLMHNLVEGRHLRREFLAPIFQDLGWPPKIRAEELLLKDYIKLTEILAGFCRRRQN